MSLTFTVTTEQQLNQAIATVDASTSGSYTIVFSTTIFEGTDTGDAIVFDGTTLSAPPDLYALNLAPGVSLTIDGADHALDGASTYRGLFAYAGAVTIMDLTIQNAHAVGGAAGSGGGGGAGLGGGLFVAGPNPTYYQSPTLTTGAQVTLDNVTFTNDAATGGRGGASDGSGGGGGGLGGPGGDFSSGGGGGGGIGYAARGANDGAAGQPGIVLGAAAAGGSTGGPYGGGGESRNDGGAGGGVGGDTNTGGNGGFGGGGGSKDGSAGSGGFGGGGGGGDHGNGGFGGGGGTNGRAGFGGGNGGGDTDGGGGGLGAGGDIFVQQGGVLTIEGGSLGPGTVTGGHGPDDGYDGQAYGGGIFLQGDQTQTLAPGAGETLTISGPIADMTGSNDPSGQTGAGGLAIDGAGTVVLDTPSTYTGGTNIDAGTLVLGAEDAAGVGVITFGGGDLPVLAFTVDTVPINPIADFGEGDVIDVTDLPYAQTGAPTVDYTTNVVTIPYALGGTAVSLQFDLLNDLADYTFHTASDGHGGTALTATIYTGPDIIVDSELELNQAIATVDAATSGSYTIVFGATIVEGTDTGGPINYGTVLQSAPADLYALNLAPGGSVTIDGADFALDGASTYRGLFAYAGAITIENLTIQNAHAVGGAAGSSGGGGAGLGGGLFVAGPNPTYFQSPTYTLGAQVTLNDVTFTNDAATGGRGGSTNGSGGGGGGLGGRGGDSDSSGGGGGGIGYGASGANDGTAAQAGIVLGAASGGGAGGPYGGGGNTAAGGGVGGSSNTGGTGGFGGGGGKNDDDAGDGGFGGGGGGGDYGKGGFGGGGGTHGKGGFGGGNGGDGDSDGGGGGLGAGGDVFVQQGGALTIEGGTLGPGTVTGGHGPDDGYDGQAYGGGIFLQGDQTQTLAPGAGETLTISGAIADMTGSNDPSGQTGAGALAIDGAGTVVLDAASTYTGGTTIDDGTLVLGAAGAAGTGAIIFGGGDPPVLAFSIADAPTNTIYGFGDGDTIDITGLPYAQTGAPTVEYTTNVVTIPYAAGGTAVSLQFDLSANLADDTFHTASDGHGGTALTATIYSGPDIIVDSELALNQAIATVDAATSGSFTIVFGATIVEGTDTGGPINYGTVLLDAPADLYALNLAAGVSVTIDGAGFALDGASTYRGLFAYAGAVTIEDLTIQNAHAVGGLGGYVAGGGAGLGGGLFVAGPNPTYFQSPTYTLGAQVTLDNVTFTNNAATGGNGGDEYQSIFVRRGGGGGLGGAGGSEGASGGGGIGYGATGATSGIPGGSGIVLGALGGGGGSDGAGGPYGGGGGGFASSGTGGAGGGVGGDPNAGGSGGFGGGGGALGHSGGDGGFGGGGGGGGFGKGGFGGGGGGDGYGGFGGGNGGDVETSAGGGGLGAGGDVFVQEGGSLTIEGGSLGASTVTRGIGPDDAEDGQAYGSGMFLQGNQTQTLIPEAGQTLTIVGGIADMTGSNDPSGQTGAAGLIIDGPGTVAFDSAGSFTGGTTIEAGALTLGAAGAAGSGEIFLDAGGGGLRLSFARADAPTNTIAGFTTDDVIDITDSQTDQPFATLNSGNDVLTIPYSGGGGGGVLYLQLAGDFSGKLFNLASDGNEGTAVTLDSAACYCRGTLILTERGEVPVEALRIGDRLVTQAGAVRPIRWIGRRSYGGVFLAGNRRVLPVRIAAGALDEGVPRRDLVVSPEHALFLDGMLVPAIALVNGRSIVQLADATTVEYFHLELDSHDVILAEGAPAESFVDDDSRGMFHNAAEYRALYPDAPMGPARFCAPRVEHGVALEPLRRRLADRAGPAPAGPAARRGYLDEASRTLIRGWAWDANRPHDRLALEIFDNGAVIARVAADCHRGDLEDAGIGDGRHGFAFAIPGGLSPETSHTIEVRYADGGGALEDSPVLLPPAPAFDDALTRAVAAAVAAAALDGAAEQARVLDFLAAQRELLLQRRADADAGRAARAADRAVRRRLGPGAVADPGLRALMIADDVPEGDDGASQAVLAQMRALRRSGHAVSFAAALGPPGTAAAVAALAREGISCWGPPVYASVEAVLRRQAGCFDVICLHGPANVARYQALARQYCPRARIVCGAEGGVLAVEIGGAESGLRDLRPAKNGYRALRVVADETKVRQA